MEILHKCYDRRMAYQMFKEDAVWYQRANQDCAIKINPSRLTITIGGVTHWYMGGDQVYRWATGREYYDYELGCMCRGGYPLAFKRSAEVD